jgi:hypothetical protein
MPDNDDRRPEPTTEPTVRPTTEELLLARAESLCRVIDGELAQLARTVEQLEHDQAVAALITIEAARTLIGLVPDRARRGR